MDNVDVGEMLGRKEENNGIKEESEKERENMELVGIGNEIEKREEELGGQDRKRMEMEKEIEMKIEIMMCDEVMEGINMVEIEEVIEVIRKVRD